jgi:hypothetical protein
MSSRVSLPATVASRDRSHRYLETEPTAGRVDPNWFYSSLAQSTAAIVGVIGGFVLSAILRQRDLASQRRLQLRRLGREIRSDCRGLTARRAQAAWLEEEILPRVNNPPAATTRIVDVRGTKWPGEAWNPQAGEAVNLGELLNHDRRLVQEFADSRLDSLFNTRGVQRTVLLQRIDKIIATDQRLAGVFNVRADSFRFLFGDAGSDAQGLRSRLPQFYALDDEISSTIVPASFRISVYLLAFLSGFGVLVPLDRLNAVSVSERTFFVALLGLGLLALLTFIYWQLRELRSLVRLHPSELDRPDLD